jgi:hypothetical protein
MKQCLEQISSTPCFSCQSNLVHPEKGKVLCKFTKIHIFSKQNVFLFVVSLKGIEVDNSKVEAIQNWSTLKLAHTNSKLRLDFIVSLRKISPQLLVH